MPEKAYNFISGAWKLLGLCASQRISVPSLYIDATLVRGCQINQCNSILYYLRSGCICFLTVYTAGLLACIIVDNITFNVSTHWLRYLSLCARMRLTISSCKTSENPWGNNSEVIEYNYT